MHNTTGYHTHYDDDKEDDYGDYEDAKFAEEFDNSIMKGFFWKHSDRYDPKEKGIIVPITQRYLAVSDV